jgi:uncharacterized protein YutE (UPF0331/DUF86 family)
MTQFTKDKLLEKKDKLLETYASLQKLQKFSLKDIQTHKENFWAVSYGLIIAIEAILDIGQYILGDKGIKADSFNKIIPLLIQEKILPKALGEKIQGMVNFRNIAVHAYPTLNEALVHKFLQENVDDFKNFLKYIK